MANITVKTRQTIYPYSPTTFPKSATAKLTIFPERTVVMRKSSDSGTRVDYRNSGDVFSQEGVANIPSDFGITGLSRNRAGYYETTYYNYTIVLPYTRYYSPETNRPIFNNDSKLDNSIYTPHFVSFSPSFPQGEPNSWGYIVDVYFYHHLREIHFTPDDPDGHDHYLHTSYQGSSQTGSTVAQEATVENDQITIGSKTSEDGSDEWSCDGQFSQATNTSQGYFKTTFPTKKKLKHRWRSEAKSSEWENLLFVPCARMKVTYNVDDNSYKLDGSTSLDPDGTIVSYAWKIELKNSAGQVIYEKLLSDDIASWQTQEVFDVLAESQVLGKVFKATLTVTDDDGLSDEVSKDLFIVRVDDEHTDALSDPHGTMFTAVNATVNNVKGVRVAGYLGQLTNRDELAFVPNLQNPSLAQHAGTHSLYLVAQDRTSKAWQIWESTDYGEGFTKMADSPLDTNYKSVVPCVLNNGGFGLAGLKKSTTPPEIYFARSWDGVTYDAIEGGTGTGQKLKLVGSKANAKTVAIQSEAANGSSRIVILCDGTPFKTSDDYGDNWDVF